MKNEFAASTGWLTKFLGRNALHNIKMRGEISSADKIAAEDFRPKLAKIIQEGDYISNQVFNADETGLFWKKMPSRAYISKSD
jgi:hypothetical protein